MTFGCEYGDTRNTVKMTVDNVRDHDSALTEGKAHNVLLDDIN